MKTRTLCILGGTGFVGRHLVNRLAPAGYAVRVPTRRRARHRELLVNPGVTLVDADIHDPAALAALFAGCDTVINLVGILNETRRGDFRRMHVELPGKVVRAAQAQGVRQLLHMSALNAYPREEHSQYLRTKGEGEDLVHAASGLLVTSFRPSVIFGPGDSLFNRFATLLRLTPLAFPLACPLARFAPVYVGDVVDAFLHTLEEPALAGRHLDLCGPGSYTLQALVEYAARTAGLRRRIVPLGDGLSRLQARLLEHLPGTPFSMDNYHSLQKDSVCHDGSLEQLGITPTALESVVPQYLGRHRTRLHYHDLRRRAGRRA